MTARKYVEYGLGERGKDFVEEMLRAGRDFSQAVETDFGVVAESVTTLLPVAIESGRLFSMRHGGVAPLNEAPTEWLVEKMRAHLSSSPSRAVVIEDFAAKPRDRSLDRVRSHLLEYRDSVFHILSPKDASEYTIRTTIADAASPAMLTAFFTEAPAALVPRARRTAIDQAVFTALVGGVASVSVLAYDGEAYILAQLRRRTA